MILLLALPAWAQEPADQELAVQELPLPGRESRSLFDSEWSLRITPSTTWLAATDLADGGDVETWVNEVRATLQGSPWFGSNLTLEAGYEHRHYDLGSPNGLFPGVEDPFEDVNTVRANASLLQGLSRSWGVFLRGGIRASAEVGADLDDGITYNVIAGVGHRFCDDFTLGVGALLLGRFEDDLLVVPGIQLDWRISEEWRLTIQGPGGRLTYKPDDHWEFTLGARFDSLRFRLEDDAATAGGIIQDQRVPVYLEARYQIDESVDLQLTVGLDVYRRFWVEDRRGDRLRERDADAAPFFGIGATIRF